LLSNTESYAGQGLLNEIINSPQDNTVRRIYADWLEDCGDLDRAEFIRVQLRLHEIAPPIITRDNYQPLLGPLTDANDEVGDARWADVWAQGELHRDYRRGEDGLYYQTLEKYPHREEVDQLREKQLRLLSKVHPELHCYNFVNWGFCYSLHKDGNPLNKNGHTGIVTYPTLYDPTIGVPDSVWQTYSRGFVSWVQIPTGALQILPRVVAAHPVEFVSLSDRSPAPTFYNARAWWTWSFTEEFVYWSIPQWLFNTLLTTRDIYGADFHGLRLWYGTRQAAEHHMSDTLLKLAREKLP
jgi:uncharacterized protein (TIGR02996 family)